MSRRTATSATAPTPSPAWRNRITGSGEEAPDQLLANPGNWRVHPKAQQDALAGALDAVGWVGQILVNQRSGCVVDGHARVALALRRGEPSVPVLYVDLDPDEEALVLATPRADHFGQRPRPRLRAWFGGGLCPTLLSFPHTSQCSRSKAADGDRDHAETEPCASGADLRGRCGPCPGWLWSRGR